MFLFLLGCQSPPKMTTQRHLAATNPDSRRFEHLSPQQVMASLRGKIRGGNLGECAKVKMNRKHRYSDITADDETVRIHVRPVDEEWDVMSATYDRYAIIENFSVPFHDSPAAYGSCKDCYQKNTHRSILIYPPPHGPSFEGFELVEVVGGGTPRIVSCGDIKRREAAR